MTDEKIIEALRCCVEHGGIDCCKSCPLTDNSECCDTLRKDTLDLIDRQQTKIKEFKVELEESNNDVQLLEAQIDGMRSISELEIYCKALRLTAEVVEEAIKDFAKEIINAIDEGTISHSSDIVDFTIDFLQELKGNELCGEK